ncbi:hypothetical protein HaLaN_04822 [Haematococcus lacustris]|uniref:AP2/ERF domain-containing protein n=1 Tax=Haematococcus lacustris TaxID=44745 RepID=A0A699YJH6_HAELA|nr:hypothetical protein HaLaN_04822 [Haematococcus lacustris]
MEAAVNVTRTTTPHRRRQREPYIYKIRGPDAPTNFPLDAAQRAELDGLSLDDVEAQFRKLGALEKENVKVTVKGVSRYRGTSPGGRQGVWRTFVTHSNVSIAIQTSEDEQEAALAWDTAMWYLRGTAMFVTADGKPRDDAPALPAAHLAKIKACLAKAGLPLAPNHCAEMTYKHAEGQGEVEQGDPGCTLVAAATVGCNGQARAASGNDGHQCLLRPPGSSDGDECCPGQASSQTECPDLIQANALTGSPRHRPLARLLEGAGHNMTAWQASGLSSVWTQQWTEDLLCSVAAWQKPANWLPMPMQDLQSITVAELMYHGAVAAGKGRLLLVTSMWHRR